MLAPRSNNHDEQGVIIILAAISLVVVLFVAGLAIDAGNLYRARLALQNASDVAALGAVSFANAQGVNLQQLGSTTPLAINNTTNMKALLDDKAIDLARANMARAGFPHVDNGAGNSTSRPVSVITNYTYDYSNGAPEVLYSYQVTTSRPIDFLLLNLIPSFSQAEPTLQATARAQRKRANVALILDASGSMECPDTGGTCSCRGVGRTGACPATPNRLMDRLIDGVDQFMDLFDVNRDNLLFVPFNTAGASYNVQDVQNLLTASGTPINFTDPMLSGELDKIKDFFTDNVMPQKETNICDAFMRAYEGIYNTIGDNEEVAYVFFSDGAPTGGRFLFTPAASASLGNNPVTIEGDPSAVPAIPSKSFGDKDYILPSVAWVSTGNAVRIGPHFLFKSQSIEPPYSPVAITPVRAACQTDPDGDGYPTAIAVDPVAGTDNAAAATNSTFSSCLSSLESHIPDDPANKYGSDYNSGNGWGSGLPGTNRSWREQFYNCAIKLSDFMRTKRGTFYTVGLGNPAAVGTDPYQGLDSADAFVRKDVFLARITFDKTQALPSAAAPLEYGFAGYETYAQVSAGSSHRNGSYFPTTNPGDLAQLFQKIGRKIHLKLVQ